MQDAERAIAKANPPRQGERTDKNNFGISNPEVEPVPETTIRDLRKAHDNITDEEFEQAKEYANRCEPMRINPYRMDTKKRIRIAYNAFQPMFRYDDASKANERQNNSKGDAQWHTLSR